MHNKQLSTFMRNFAPLKRLVFRMKILSNAQLAELLDKDIFHQIGEAADALGVPCYVVGGYVRDLFWNARLMI